jgi:hypothetical protein
MAFVAFLSFGTMSTLALAEEEKKDKDKGGQVVVFSDDKQDEKKDQGGKVIFSDDKQDEKKDDKGGK